jgi:RNA polymerase-interacting CarD/CdnL/TRCF family regulator
MESQMSQNSQTLHDSTSELSIGTPVIYGLHGKCTVVGVETRALAGETQRFYKLERQKSPLSRSTRFEPAIFLPVTSAKNRGLRSPMNQNDINAAFQIFGNREYYFSTSEQWHTVQTKLEDAIRNEGSLGMAKSLSFLFVLRKKEIVSHPEVTKFAESILKNFVREVSEITGETSKQIEDKMNRAMKLKLLADQ